jgi:hypothetical protein
MIYDTYHFRGIKIDIRNQPHVGGKGRGDKCWVAGEGKGNKNLCPECPNPGIIQSDSGPGRSVDI